MKEYHLTSKQYQQLAPKYLHGKYIIGNVGTFYYENGIEHRIDGPAVEYFDGEKYWRFNGELHRLDGPAVERIGQPSDYYINDELYDSKEEYEIAVYLYKNQLENYK